MSEKIRVVIIDDHMVVREGIAALLAANPRIEVVAKGWVGDHVRELAVAHQPDVLITDLQMPAREGSAPSLNFEPVSGIREATALFPDMAVIVISQEQNVYTVQGLAEAGVSGYFLKNDDIADNLGSAVEQISRGGAYFSPAIAEMIRQGPKLEIVQALSGRELEVLGALLRSPAASTSELAGILRVSFHTADKHLRSARRKLGAPTKASLIVNAMRLGLAEDLPSFRP